MMNITDGVSLFVLIILATSAGVIGLNIWSVYNQPPISEIPAILNSSVTETHNGIVFTQTRLGSMNATCIIGSSMGSTMMFCKFDKED